MLTPCVSGSASIHFAMLHPRLVAAVAAIISVAAQPLAPTLLRVDGRETPVLGVESRTPSLQWAAPTDQDAQASVQVELRALPSGSVVWDSAQVSTTALSLAYSGPALSSMTTYSWRVRSWGVNSSSPTAYSAPGTFVTGVWGTWSAATPVWHPNATAQFVFLRADLPMPSPAAPLFSAIAYVTANPQPSTQGETENGKLLAAYRLYVEGSWVGLGPGRPGNCGPICPLQNDPLPCPCSHHHWYDTYNVTALVREAAGRRGGSAAGSLTLALQNFNYPPSGGVKNITSQVILQARSRR